MWEADNWPSIILYGLWHAVYIVRGQSQAYVLEPSMHTIRFEANKRGVPHDACMHGNKACMRIDAYHTVGGLHSSCVTF